MPFIHEHIDLGYDDLNVETSESGGRRYVDPDGNKYPSVTTVLGILTEQAIREWRMRVGEDEANRVSNRASSRGTSVHAIVEKYLKNEDTSEYLPHIQQSLANLKPILDSRIGRIFGIESPLYSRYLALAGRCDCVAEFDGVPSIIDFKTSKKKKSTKQITDYYIQGCAYAVAHNEMYGTGIRNIAIVMTIDGADPIIFEQDAVPFLPLLKNRRLQYDKLATQ